MSIYESIPMRKVTPPATLPTTSSSGLDLYSSQSYLIPPFGRALVKTGIAMALPSNYYGREVPLASLSISHGIEVGAGVIDSDYRGEVHCLLFNFGDKDFKISPGDKIAHLIIQKISMAEVEEVSDLDQIHS